MGSKAERRAVRDRVSSYHQAQLAELLSHVGTTIDRYRAGEIDADAVDETIHHYHRAAAELWKFCFARHGGAQAAFTAGLLDRMTAGAEAIDWWHEPHRHDINDHDRAALPARVPRSVTDRCQNSHPLSASSRRYGRQADLRPDFVHLDRTVRSARLAPSADIRPCR